MKIIKYIWSKIVEEKFVLLFLTLLGMFRGFHEVSKFRIDMTWIWIWDYPFGIKSPPLDAYHVYGGLFSLAIIAGFRLRLLKNIKSNHLLIALAIIVVEFFYMFWIFDLFYHVVLMLEKYNQWEYVLWFL